MKFSSERGNGKETETAGRISMDVENGQHPTFVVWDICAENPVMGVRGLRKFMNDQNNVIRPHKLRNTNLIMDGNNLCKRVADTFWTSDRSIYGGDYNICYSEFRRLLSNLLKCKIRVIVIFDGLAPDKKENKVNMNRNKKLEILDQLYDPNCEAVVYPLFLFDAFCKVLRDLQVEHRQCYGDADKAIANIAKYSDCPVLSEDSDFFIYDVSFIPFDKVDLTPKKDENGFYISCFLYKSEHLIDQLPRLHKSLIPLVPVLLGNDTINQSLFRNFLRCGPYDRPAATFRWLQMQKNRQVAISKMLTFLSYRGNVKYWEHVIEECLNEYSVSNPCSLSNLNAIEFIPKDHHDVLSKMPNQFVERVENCKLYTLAMNLALNKPMYMSIHVEDIKQKSPYYISIPILQGIYKIIKSLKGKMAANDTMDIYMRNGGSYENYKIGDIDDGFDYNIQNLMHAEECEKRRLFFRCLALEGDDASVNDFDEDWRLFLISVMYWMKNAEGLLKSHWSAVLLMALANYAERKFEDADLSSGLLESVSREEVERFVRKLNEYREPHQNTGERGSILPIIHLFASLQSCMVYVMQLNALLAEPFQELDVYKFYSGTLLWNVYCKAVESNTFPDTLFEDLPGMKQVYMHLEKSVSLPVEQIFARHMLRVRGSAND